MRGPGPEWIEPVELGGGERASVAELGAEPAALAAPSSQIAAEREPLKVLLQGSVRAQVPDLWRTRIVVDEPETVGQRIEAPVDAAGRFEVDVTPLVHRGVLFSPPGRLVVHADHPACLRLERSVPLHELRSWAGLPDPVRLAAARARPPLDPSASSPDPDGTRVIEVELELERGASLVGRVRLPEGAVLRGAFVAAAGIEPETDTPAAAWAEISRLDPAGNFELRVAPGGRYAVVAATQFARPATEILEVQHPGEYLVDLELEPGLALEGTLRLGSEPAPVGVAVVALLDPATSSPYAQIPGVEALAWSDGRFEWRSRLARTDARGRFSVGGLGPQERSLRVLALGMPGFHTRSVEAGSARPPREELVVGPLFAQVVLRFAPAAAWPVSFVLQEVGSERERLGPFVADADGRAALWLPPHASFDVLVDGDLLGSVATGAAGERGEWVLAP